MAFNGGNARTGREDLQRLHGRVHGRHPDSESPAGARTTSADATMCTGPGRSAIATRKAFRRMLPAASGTIRVAHFVTESNRRYLIDVLMCEGRLETTVELPRD